MTYFRLDHDISLPEFFIDTLLTHNINRLVQYAPHVECFIAVRTCRYIYGNNNICSHIFGRFYWNWTNQTAIDIFCTANYSGHKDIRNTARGTHGLSGIAFDKVSFTAIVQAGCHCREANRELFNRFIRHIFIDEILQFLSGNNPLAVQG